MVTNTLSGSIPARLGIMAKLFIAILLIAVFEGAARKWFSDGLTYPLIALRDSFALVGIFYALKKGCVRNNFATFQLLALLSVLLIVWGLIQLLINQSSPLVFLVGLRFWLLYLWFAVLAGIAMSEHDFKTITKVLISLLICMAPLAVIQHYLPPTSFLNKQVDESGVFLVTRDIVRTTGTFSFTLGFTTYLAMVTPFVFLSLDNRSRLWRSKWMPMLALSALFVATIVSGSRGAVIFFGLLFLMFSFVSLWFSKGRRKGRALFLLLLMSMMFVALLSVFSRAVIATQERFISAAESESFFGRLAYNFFPQGDVSFLGEGIGMGSNYSAVLETGMRQFLLAESENARVILEAGLLGVIFIIVKIGVVIIALWQGLKLARRDGNVFHLMIWSTVGLALLSWSIIGQLTVNVLGYLLIGLAIASLKPQPN